jgi:copper chaperone CopZ
MEENACRICAQAIKHELKKIPGVKSIQLDFGNSVIEVEYDALLDLAPLFEEKINRLGYHLSGNVYRKTALTCQPQKIQEP